MIGDLSSLISPFDLPSTATEIRRGGGGLGGGGGRRGREEIYRNQHVEIVKIIQTEAVHFHNGGRETDRQTETDTDRERQRQKNRDRRTEERQTDRDRERMDERGAERQTEKKKTTHSSTKSKTLSSFNGEIKGGSYVTVFTSSDQRSKNGGLVKRFVLVPLVV